MPSSEELLARLGIPVATFVWCLVGGIVPIASAELFLLAVAALADPSRLWLVVALATAGQMTAKTLVFQVGRGAVRLPWRGPQVDLEAMRTRVAGWRSRDLLVFVSAASGLPPFYVTSILAGSLGLPLARFVGCGIAGTMVRYAVLVAVPGVGRWIVGGWR